MTTESESIFGVKLKSWQAYSILVSVYLLITGWNISLQHIVSPDEPRYAEGALEMMRGGDLIVPMFNAHPHIMKPGLFYWLLVIAGQFSNFLGISLDTAGFRLVPLFMGLLLTLGTCVLGQRLLSRRAGFVAAVVLMTTYQFHNVARELVIDMTLSAILLWSWLFFDIALKRIEEDRPRFWPLFAFYVCLGLASISKGPCLVAVFSTLPLLVYLIWGGKLKWVSRAGLWWGMPLALTIGLSWFVALSLKGQDSVRFFTVENIGRFFGQKDHVHVIPFFYYIISMPEIFAPWFLLFPFAAWWSYKCFMDKHTSFVHGERLLYCALLLPFVVLSLSGSKRHLYLMPIFPFVSLWVAWYLENTFLARSPEPAKVWLANLSRAAGIAIFAGFASTPFWLGRMGGKEMEIAVCMLLGTVSLFVFASAASALRRGYRELALARILLVAMVLCFGLESVVRPIHERALDVVNFYEQVSRISNGRRLVLLGLNSNEASWYMGNPAGPINEVTWSDLKTQFFNSPDANMLVSVSLLRHSAELTRNVMVISPVLCRNNTSFVMVRPNSGSAPDPSLFSASSSKKDQSSLKGL